MKFRLDVPIRPSACLNTPIKKPPFRGSKVVARALAAFVRRIIKKL
jgi:hypothetical protein